MRTTAKRMQSARIEARTGRLRCRRTRSGRDFRPVRVTGSKADGGRQPHVESNPGWADRMSRVGVLGSGISGHTAAAFARRWLGREHSVTVVSPRDHYNWIPSNIWVGVGLMSPKQVTFPLRPV